jgi:hypothetical protein
MLCLEVRFFARHPDRSNYTTRGTNGFYLVPLFGAAADFLVLMALWFVVVRVVQQFREKQNIQQS